MSKVYGTIETTLVLMLDELNEEQAEQVKKILGVDELNKEIEVMEEDVMELIANDLAEKDIEELLDKEYDTIVVVPK